MRFCKTYQFDHGIKGFKLGWSLAGPPLMTVYFYLFDNIMVDTGQSHMEKEVVAIARENNIRNIFLPITTKIIPAMQQQLTWPLVPG